MITTAIESLPYLSASLGIEVLVKRDDLFGDSGGGNKARKMRYIVHAARRAGASTLVTTGGLQSNHARATALAAAREGWRCHLVLHGDPATNEVAAGNYLLTSLLGARIDIVPSSEIAAVMADSIRQLKSNGEVPYEIQGGGHCTEGAMAYVDAVNELKQQAEALDWHPDVVVCASGTGTTQAGILAGFESSAAPPRVIGVSVARTSPRGTAVVTAAYRDIRRALGYTANELPVEFRDDWIDGGYEVASDRVLAAIRLAARCDGLLLDPTYTGKAFCGLVDMVNRGEIPQGSRVLFWHTGGLVNLLAATGYAKELSRP